ncbi:hypothetical protein BDP81DRAFT_440461 [Colletotrichum phormii]|uniref:Uncharacterized protein n=1 Tax=Colletotrichum phormii TaxID=359342 RepID=A0AAJ0E9K3_9PEZI|nr:uncharacterized protein BDP81DRAFT_440461 [Colletotrichum phormii]KAK1622905.1 hypothetical protein BDP81DRAFT_440461 [Colletotrichum phormii]
MIARHRPSKSVLNVREMSLWLFMGAQSWLVSGTTGLQPLSQKTMLNGWPEAPQSFGPIHHIFPKTPKTPKTPPQTPRPGQCYRIRQPYMGSGGTPRLNKPVLRS